MSIASASAAVKFHDLPSGTVLHNYQPSGSVDGPVRSISWSKDGKWLALVPSSGPAEIISVKDQLKLLHVIEGIEEPLCAAFQNTTKKNIAVGTKSGQVLLYDIKARNVKKRYPRATSAIRIVEFTAKDNHVVVACENGEAHLYSNVTNGLAGSFKIPRSQTIRAMRTNPIKRNYVVAGSDEGVVAVWDIHGNKTKFCVGSHKAAVTAVAFSPINSDLVVSTGLDRQFCFYDIGGNKCIGSIFVENSMTSVDFSPDGKFVVMASQKGKIYIYDSKNIQQPIHSFCAHDSAIDHLSFRKSEDHETSFTLSASENLKESSATVDSQRNVESFSLYMMPDNVPVDAESSEVFAADVSDSFVLAMGLDQSNTADSAKPDLSARTAEHSRKFSAHKRTPSSSKLLQEKVHGHSKIQLTSTPNCFNEEIPPLISPIVSSAIQTCPCEMKSNLESLKSLVKNTVKEELKVVSQGLKDDMKYYSTHTLSQMRQMCLDMLMSMIKEFIKVDNNFTDLQAQLVCDMPQDLGPLLEENMMLREKVAILEDELSILKENIINKNVS